MAYIGNQVTVGNFVKLDAIVTSATATYNLLNGGVAYSPQSPNHCIVSLNGVIQSPTTSFTISGSTIVFASALTATDVIDFILVLGDVLNIGTPSDATVTNAKLALTAGSAGTPAISIAADTNTGIFFPAADTIGFAEGGTEAMRIDSSGNVGIGITSPRAKTDIFASAVSGAFSAGTLSTWRVLQVRNNIDLNTGTAAGIALGGDVDNDTSTAGIVGISDNSSGGVCQLAFLTATGNTSTERMRILSGGNVCIARTSNPSNSQVNIQHVGASEYGLTLDSNTSSGTIYHLEFKRQNSQAGYITSSATAVSVNNTSDARLKENIQNSNSAIQDLKNIQVRQFDWIDNIDTHRDFGFVAQELINVVPEAVTVGSEELNENGKPKQTWGIDYSHIVPRLVKVCQEQQAIIEQLEARLTALENN